MGNRSRGITASGIQHLAAKRFKPLREPVRVIACPSPPAEPAALWSIEAPALCWAVF